MGVLFLTNASDSSIIAKSGGIIHVENSGTVGVGEGVVFGEELVVGAGAGDEVDVGVVVGDEVGVTAGEGVAVGVGDGLGDGDGVDAAAVKSILT